MHVDKCNWINLGQDQSQFKPKCDKTKRTNSLERASNHLKWLNKMHSWIFADSIEKVVPMPLSWADLNKLRIEFIQAYLTFSFQKTTILVMPRCSCGLDNRMPMWEH